MQWHQNYSAVDGSLLLTALVVAIPCTALVCALVHVQREGNTCRCTAPSKSAVVYYGGEYFLPL